MNRVLDLIKYSAIFKNDSYKVKAVSALNP